MHEPQTALLLTESEWADLVVICRQWSAARAKAPEPFVQRRLALADRVIDAAD